MKFIVTTGTNEEGLRVWKIGSKENRAMVVARSTLNTGIRYWARTAGRASLTHALEVSSWAITTDRNLREWWGLGVGGGAEASAL